MYPWERDITREILNSTENPWINKEAIEDVCQGKFIKIVLVTVVFKNMEPIKTRLPITRVCTIRNRQFRCAPTNLVSNTFPSSWHE